MKKTATLLMMMLITACTWLETETYSDIEITPIHTVYPDLPGFQIHIPANVRSQNFLFEWYIDGEKHFSEWVYLKSGTTSPVQILVDTGSHDLRVTLSVSDQGEIRTVYNRLMRLIYSKTVTVEKYPHGGDVTAEV